MLTIDVEDRIRKFKMVVYDVLLNTSILSEVIGSELITCIAIYRLLINTICF